MDLRCASTRRSKDLITTEVRATGLESLCPVWPWLFEHRDDGGGLETGLETWHFSKEVLKMVVNTGDSWLVQCLRVAGETESGPAALQGFCLLKRLFVYLS